MITSRIINIKSDCGKYRIKAKLVAESDGFTQDNWSCRRSYSGSHWECSLYNDGKLVDGIQAIDGNYQSYITISGICEHGIRLTKNTILYLAFATRMFTKELNGVDTSKVERQYYKDYVAARIADNTL